MWLLAKKKGVSIMVGYVLLVTCAIIIGVIVYRWIITYVPADALECPEGVSIFIKEYKYDCDNSELDLTLKNNGLFNIAGYFIHATNESEQELATIDLSGYTSLGKGMEGTVLFKTRAENSFEPNDEITNIFDLSDSGIGNISSIEIIPVRFQEVDNRMRFVSCGGSRVKEMVSCWVACVAETTEETCGTWVCGTKKNNCDEDVICLPDDCGDDTCINGVCVPPDCIPEDISVTCGTWGCGDKVNNCGVIVSCPPGCDPVTEECISGICTPISSCNGVWEGVDEDADVECDGTPLPANCVDCVCTDPYVSDGNGGCIIPLDFGCADYCIELLGYTYGACVANTGQCTSLPGDVVGQGPEVYCKPPLEDYYCCCAPPL